MIAVKVEEYSLYNTFSSKVHDQRRCGKSSGTGGFYHGGNFPLPHCGAEMLR